ncbi:bifunctional aspartate kinase/homoserine dehydrogenase I [Flavobacteriales bacterium]|nr:bifunctional aspartate kinase/homoserine dehydrogenase I [Flavobacteriales bacterium]
MNIEILKFGGSSLASAEELRKVADVLLARRAQQRVVVCSAMGGVTNDLINIGLKATRGDEGFRIAISELEKRHMHVARELGIFNDEVGNDEVGNDEGTNGNSELPNELQVRLNELKALCDGLYLIGELSAKSMDQLVSFGERMAVPLVAAWLRSNGLNVRRTDARDWIKTDEHYGAAEVCREETNRLIRDGVVSDMQFEILLTEGFIGRSEAGNTTTLGRGGSDYTASLIASALEAKCMEKSTDVPGMLTADPRIVVEADIIPEMSYEEAMELCHFGAKVIYHPTIQPLRESGIPLIVRSTFQSDAPGTRIVKVPSTKALVRGLSSVNDISLITLEGGQSIGRPGFSSRVFSLLAEFQVNVVLITQSSSENSLTLGVANADLEAARKALSQGLEADIMLKRLAPIRIDSELSIVAIVGGGMVSTSGVSGKAFQALAKSSINVRAIAQGSTERNISIVVKTSDVSESLRALHRAFFEIPSVKTVHVFCAGVGQVGSAFLEQLLATRARILEHHQIDYRLVGICNSKRVAWFDDASPDWQGALANGEQLGSVREAFDQFQSLPLERKVWVDNTASPEVAAITPTALALGVSVVCSNKIAATGNMASWESMQSSLEVGCVMFQNETNVGAALPVIGSLKNMIATGDRVQNIEGVLSGSLNFVFSKMDEGMTFASAVEMAMDLGYAEPDARLDLSGMDVSRKILILARVCGAKIELADVDVQGFIKTGAMDVSLAEFKSDIEKWGEPVRLLHEQAVLSGHRLRFVAEWNGEDICRCSLRALAPDHPFYSLEGTDNAIAISSSRYSDRPLVIQGAGAGAILTASGVLTDVQEIGRSFSDASLNFSR